MHVAGVLSLHTSQKPSCNVGETQKHLWSIFFMQTTCTQRTLLCMQQGNTHMVYLSISLSGWLSMYPTVFLCFLLNPVAVSWPYVFSVSHQFITDKSNLFPSLLRVPDLKPDKHFQNTDTLKLVRKKTHPRIFSHSETSTHLFSSLL